MQVLSLGGEPWHGRKSYGADGPMCSGDLQEMVELSHQGMKRPDHLSAHSHLQGRGRAPRAGWDSCG